VTHTRKTVLVIEDDAQLRHMLTAALGSHAFAPEVAVDGKEGLRLAALHHPDSVVIDLDSLGTSALEVILRLREWYTRPILAMSSKGSDAATADQLGANRLLSDPSDVRNLLARLRGALRAKHANETRSITARRRAIGQVAQAKSVSKIESPRSRSVSVKRSRR
jgi:two-component system KDP operon response regulator KdpE